MTMTKEQLASTLDGRCYGDVMTRNEAMAARDSGLVVVFGGSDDLVILEGAVDDEKGAGDGTVIAIDKEGILPDFHHLCQEEDMDGLRDYFRRESHVVGIRTLWCREPDTLWTYETSIPHATFRVVEDGQTYCRGIVFRLEDACPA